MACVLYFGGDKLSLITAKPSVNQTFVTKSWAGLPYSGIVGGEFVDSSELPKIVSKLVSSVTLPTLSKLTVAVPPCFCSVKVTQEKISLKKPKKITQKDVTDLLNGGRAVYFKIDGGKPILDAVGYDAKNILEANVSHLAIAPEFCDAVNNCVGRKFAKVEFIPTVLAEATYLIDTYVRDATCVLLSCKMFTTTVAVISGDQLVALETVEMGTAHVINDISLVLNVNYNLAKEMLDRNDPSVTEIVTARIEDLAEQLLTAINATDKTLFNRPFFMGGGHIDAIPTVHEILEGVLDVKIVPLVHPLTESNDPDGVSRDAVISTALFN